MSDDVLVKVDNVSKKFCRSLKHSLWYGVQDVSSELLGREGRYDELRKNEFWAVNDISFELKRGECLGLIGKNGAGKTTLLRMLNGLIRPDQGRIEMRGKVGALIALGAGFDPILTGRENIYVNASILGMNKRLVDRKLDEIIDFAEIRDSINSPVQTYSSGMNVRLGFAIAAILIEPDILFLDEVLAVGDIGFAIKCLNTVRRMTNKSAVVFVSHNMQQVSRFCTRVMVMSEGKVLLDGTNPAEGIHQYHSLVKHEIQTSGNGKAEIYALELIVNEKTEMASEPMIPHGAKLGFRIRLRLDDTVAGATMLVNISDEAMNQVITMPVCDSEGAFNRLPAGELEIEIKMGTVELSSGKYSMTLGVVDSLTNEVLVRVQGLSPFQVIADRAYWGKMVRNVVPRKISVHPTP